MDAVYLVVGKIVLIIIGFGLAVAVLLFFGFVGSFYKKVTDWKKHGKDWEKNLKETRIALQRQEDEIRDLQTENLLLKKQSPFRGPTV